MRGKTIDLIGVSCIGEHHFGPNDNAKTYGQFLLCLTKLAPREALKSITAFVGLLDSESYSLRIAMVELVGSLLVWIQRENREADAASFFGLLLERFRDVHSAVRAKVVGVTGDLLRAGAMSSTQRDAFLELTISRIQDRASTVRRRAIQTLGEFIRTHPFCIEGGELSLGHFQSRLAEVDAVLEGKVAQEGGADDPNLSMLLLQKRYYSDAVRFVQTIEAAMPVLSKLLNSASRFEAFDVMDLLVEAQIYRIEGAREGVRKMMHLVWDQEACCEEGSTSKRSVRDHLLEAYRRIYLETGDERMTGRERAIQIAQNLLLLVAESSRTELGSLEAILGLMSGRGWIPGSAIEALQCVLASPSVSAPGLRCGALVLIAMLGAVDAELVQSNLETIMQQAWASKDPLMAEYGCLAITRAFPSERLSPEHPIMTSLVALFERCRDGRWLQVISIITKTIYKICSHPAKVIVRLLALYSTNAVSVWQITRLVQVIGEIALAESAHLEVIQSGWKKVAGKKDPLSNEFDQIAGSQEDHQRDQLSAAILMTREHAILYGDGSLLRPWAVFVAKICARNDLYQDPLLQTVASLTLAKFMAISGRYCQEHLSLLLTILERSDNSTIRANLVVALGDLIQAHGQLVDQNVDLLFRRLGDAQVTVQRQALLVLMHLILTGLLKVKGRLGEIAKCLEHPDPSIADLARLFFHELASKDPLAIYNHIPDVVSTLLHEKEEEEDLNEMEKERNESSFIDEPTFQAIMRIIFGHVKRERQMEGLVEKLIQRFRTTNSPSAWRNISYCLGLVSYSGEKALRRLIDGFPIYREKLLMDPAVYRNFGEILSKTRKSVNATGEVRGLLDELERKLLAITEETTTDTKQDPTLLEDEMHSLSVHEGRKKNSRRPNARKNVFAVSEDEEEKDAGPRGVFQRKDTGDDEDDDTAPVRLRRGGGRRKQTVQNSQPTVLKIISQKSDEESDSFIESGPE